MPLKDPTRLSRAGAGRHRWFWLTTVADLDGPGRASAAMLSRWPTQDEHMVCSLRRASPGFRAAIPSEPAVVDLDLRAANGAAALLRLLKLCRRWRPDLIHTQLSRADWIGRVLGKALGIPVVSTIHNLHTRMYAAEFSAALARTGLALDGWTLPLADVVVAVSAGVRDDVTHSHGRTDVRIIRNGLDLSRLDRLRSRDEIRRAWGVSDAARVAGTVALLKYQKGIPSLVDAARIVCSRLPDARFVHMGGGPLAADTARRIADAGLADRFLLQGHVEDPMSCLPGLDLFVLPSRWEGLPIALLEAMAVGLPAVGTAVSGLDELIDDGVGLLVPPDNPDALADGIVGLLTDDGRRHELGRGARARAMTMDAALAATAYRELFLELTAR